MRQRLCLQKESSSAEHTDSDVTEFFQFVVERQRPVGMGSSIWEKSTMGPGRAGQWVSVVPMHQGFRFDAGSGHIQAATTDASVSGTTHLRLPLSPSL